MIDPSSQKQSARVLTRVLGCQPDDLPSLPAAAWELNQLAENDDATVDQMERVIKKDPPLASRLLKVANSPSFRIRAGGRIIDISRAVVVMGFEEVSSLALGLTVLSALGGDRPLKGRMQLIQLWRHSVTVGLLCEILARDSLGWGTGFYSFGLVHDIGKVAFNAFRQQQYEKVLAQVESTGVTPAQAENEALLVDHSFVGKALFEHWEMNSAMVAVAAHHHDPWEAGEHKDLAGLVFLADLLANILGYCSCPVASGFNAASLLTGNAGSFLAEQGWDLPRFMTPDLKGNLEDALEKMDPAGLV